MLDYFINIYEGSTYPSSEFCFSPDTLYPEYPFRDHKVALAKIENYPYRMVRDTLAGLEMDKEGFGTKDWNPLGEIIKPGDKVLIKPNWVMHRNKNKNVTENALECMITHPSVVRAVIDYCLIALKGKGSIIIGDSPMQGCDLEKLMQLSGYDKLFSFFSCSPVGIIPMDFRLYATLVDSNKVLIGKKQNNTEIAEVELGKRSRLDNITDGRIFKVSDYSREKTNSYHRKGKHTYAISREVLTCDVVINMAKPKCHRLAGITGMMKNIVGITAEKACLPHRSIGSKEEGGDEYLHNSWLKKITDWVLEKKLEYEEKGRFKLSLLMRYTYGVLYYMIRATGKDRFLVGSWYGNDTIWRTVLDLYLILLYADGNGEMTDSIQRTVFNIGDMIISGEGNGPVAPEPKKLGIILAGKEAVITDRLVCEIMGFDFNNLPVVRNSLLDPELCNSSVDDVYFFSNKDEFCNRKLKDMKFPDTWNFKPYETWKGHIEKRR